MALVRIFIPGGVPIKMQFSVANFMSDLQNCSSTRPKRVHFCCQRISSVSLVSVAFDNL